MSGNTSSFAISPSPILKNPEIINYTITAPNSEETISLPVGTKQFVIQNIGNRIIKLAYAVGESGTNFYNLYPGLPHTVNGIGQSSVILYLQSSGLESLQIEIWK